MCGSRQRAANMRESCCLYLDRSVALATEQPRRSFKQARLAWAAPARWLLHHGGSEHEAQTESGHQI